LNRLRESRPDKACQAAILYCGEVDELMGRMMELKRPDGRKEKNTIMRANRHMAESLGRWRRRTIPLDLRSALWANTCAIPVALGYARGGVRQRCRAEREGFLLH
jgi:hypothetical protein